MIDLKLPTWLNGEIISPLKTAAVAWWAKVESWITWPLRQMDADTCTLGMLDLLAWQRDIDRFPGEPEWLYRRRVSYAVTNAKDAGSTAGLIRIFERLDIGLLEIDERVPDRDWDVIILQLTDSQLSDNRELLRVMIEMYGRTCRRYELTTLTKTTVEIRVAIFDNDHLTVKAK